MRKVISIVTLLSLIVVLAFPANTTATTYVTGKIIAIDPGHGGSDTGTTQCSTLVEKEATLQISRILRDMLEANGATVVMTRDADISLGNTERATIANNAKANVLVSVHLNGSTDHSVNYTLGLYGKKNKDYDFTTVIHNAQYAALGIPDGGVSNFASGVLLKSEMPATITESVFLSNTEECTKLSNGTMTRQTEIAQSMYNGLQAWFQQQSSGSDGGSTKPGNGKPSR